jgi:GNAT superfamily N-acetyltransferase
MAITLQGFDVRRPRADELPLIEPWFAGSQLGWSESLVQAAFGQPGDVPLGAVIVRPSRGGTVGQFTIYVRPDCRRRGIGRHLMGHLYQLALANKAEHLVLTELVHQDEPENDFYRAVGLTPDLSLGTYELDLPNAASPLCEPIARRFMKSHRHLSGVRIVSLEAVDPGHAAAFLTTHYSGFVEQQTQRMREGFFDRTLSTVAVREDGSISGLALFVSKPNDPAIFLDLVLTEPTTRNGPTPLVLFAETARLSLAAGKTTVVFEADSKHDPFAVGFAHRCGVTSPRWYRYRYTIGRADFSNRI